MASRFLSGVTVLSLLCANAPATSPSTRASADADTLLTDGQSASVSFRVAQKRTVLICVQGRINRPEGTPAAVHAMRLQLDGQDLTPEAVKVLNKRDMLAGPDASAGRLPLYDAGAWLLKCGQTYDAYLDALGVSDGVRQTTLSPHARFSHYHEYLIRLDGLAAGEHRLTAIAALPKALADASIHLRRLSVHQPDGDVVLGSQDWMKVAFPWEPPSPEQFLAGPLRVRACAGEYEPVTLSLLALIELPEVNVRVSDLQRIGGEDTIAASNVATFAVTTLDKRKLRVPFAPDGWQDKRPELLLPLAEKTLHVPANLTQRLFLDMRIPEGQAPGVYRGTVHVLSGRRVLAEVPLECTVLPFELSAARQTYWMWRRTWSDITLPSNQACLRDIREHGFTGLTARAGAAFKFSVTDQGEVQLDTSS